MLKLLGKSSSINVRKVLWLFDELGLAYEQEQYGAGFSPTTTDGFLALNPNAMVPVLVDGEFVLWESNTICRYLASREQRFDLLPASPKERALVEKWMDWQATELNNSWRYPFMALVRQSPAHRDPSAIHDGVKEWNRHMWIVEDQIQKTGAFITGEAFTVADIVIGLSVHRWFMTPMDHAKLPGVSAYYERLSERRGYQVHGRNGTP